MASLSWPNVRSARLMQQMTVSLVANVFNQKYNVDIGDSSSLDATAKLIGVRFSLVTARRLYIRLFAISRILIVKTVDLITTMAGDLIPCASNNAWNTNDGLYF